MEIAMPLVVGGLAGLSVATACGAEPRVSRMPPAELARQTLESMAEKLPRELAENDLLTKIARSWASLIPADRLGLAIEDNAAVWHFCCCRAVSAAFCWPLRRCRPSALSWGWWRRLAWAPRVTPSIADANSMM